MAAGIASGWLAWKVWPVQQLDVFGKSAWICSRRGAVLARKWWHERADVIARTETGTCWGELGAKLAHGTRHLAWTAGLCELASMVMDEAVGA